jgi:zinc/manganese transport system substrate-binding protein
MLLTSSVACAGPLRVASLNPVVSDLARQVGGDDVEVIDLMPVGVNPHTFYPSPEALKATTESDLLLVAGKGLETYITEFTVSLGGKPPVFCVGCAVPSLRVEVDDVFICCPEHAKGSVDPHWWHSVRNARRAATAIAKEFCRRDAANADDYERRADSYAARLDALHRWARKEVGRIPRRDRELTTSHAAFGYLCRELGLRSITVQGLTTEDHPSPTYLKEVIQTLRKHGVKAVFPEDNANPKVLGSMVREAGVELGGALYAGTLPIATPTYEAMIRHNISTIVESLLESNEE